jgi:hypothetical protein
LIEEQDVVGFGNKLAPCNALQKHARARKDNVMLARTFFRAMLSELRAAADIVNCHASAPIEQMCLQAHPTRSRSMLQVSLTQVLRCAILDILGSTS